MLTYYRARLCAMITFPFVKFSVSLEMMITLFFFNQAEFSISISLILHPICHRPSER